jgi:hypothetical protein
MSRPEKKIDWKLVDKLLMAGCEGTQIAPHFDMHYETFYRRVQEKYGMGFTEYCALKRYQGDSFLLDKQFQKAREGDNVMLVWLGKNRLKQTESPQEVAISKETMEYFKTIMSQLSDLQRSESTIDCKIKNTDCKSE